MAIPLTLLPLGLHLAIWVQGQASGHPPVQVQASTGSLGPRWGRRADSKVGLQADLGVPFGSKSKPRLRSVLGSKPRDPGRPSGRRSEGRLQAMLRAQARARSKPPDPRSDFETKSVTSDRSPSIQTKTRCRRSVLRAEGVEDDNYWQFYVTTLLTKKFGFHFHMRVATCVPIAMCKCKFFSNLDKFTFPRDFLDSLGALFQGRRRGH